MTSLPVPLVVEMAISRSRVGLLGRVPDHALADVQERRGQFLQVGLRRFVLELHDLRRVDHRSAAQRDDLVGLVQVQRLHALHHDLDLGLRVGNGETCTGVSAGIERRTMSTWPSCSSIGLVTMMVERDGNWRRFSTAFMLK